MFVRAGARFAGVVALGALSACGRRAPAPSVQEPRPAGTAAPGVAPPPSSSEPGPTRNVRDARCEPASCDYRTEICCETAPDRRMSGCQKRPPAAEAEARGHKCSAEFSSDWIGIGCLDGSDCEPGTKCCAFGELTHCTAACEEHEACVPGRPETCHAGSRCEASGSRSGGSCVVAAPSTACGKLRCSGDKAGCRYDRKARRGECLELDAGGEWTTKAMESLDDHTSLLRCASPKDCAGERCCTAGPLPMTECSGSCMSGIDVCDTIADCPEFVGPPTGCEADPEHPPFLKTCRYRAP